LPIFLKLSLTFTSLDGVSVGIDSICGMVVSLDSDCFGASAFNASFSAFNLAISLFALVMLNIILCSLSIYCRFFLTALVLKPIHYRMVGLY